MNKNTMTDLVTELKKLSPVICVNDLISLAEKGEFHDYRSSQVCGKVFAVKCIDYSVSCGIGLTDSDKESLEKIRLEIIEGEYDEPCTDEDKALMIKEAEEDPNMSERDKEFFITALGGKPDANRGGFGKRYF